MESGKFGNVARVAVVSDCTRKYLLGRDIEELGLEVFN